MINKFNYPQSIKVDFTLEQLLQHIRTITNSDAGTIYLKNDDSLQFKIFQNDTISKSILEEKNLDIFSIKLSLLNEDLVAVQSCNKKQVINIDDVYCNFDFDLSGTKTFDAMFDYKTHSMLTIPLIHPFQENVVIGVLQIINKKIATKFESYTKEDEKYLLLSSTFISMIILNIQEYISNLQDANQLLKEKITTEIKKNEEKNTLIFHNHKIFQMNEMIKNISHQWRNPLGELSLNNTLLERKLEQPELINILIENNQIIQQLSKTINNFQIVFDDIEGMQHNLFSIKKAIYEALTLINIYIESYKIEIIENIDDTLQLYGNKNYFSQIILTILQNTIELVKNQKIKNTKISLAVILKDGMVLINIRDNLKNYDLKNLKLQQQYFLGIEIITLLLKQEYNGKFFVNSLENGLEYLIQIPSNTEK